MVEDEKAAGAGVPLFSQVESTQAGLKKKLLRPFDLYLLAVLILIKLAPRLAFLNAGDLLGRAAAFAAFHLSRRKRGLAKRSLSKNLELSAAQTRTVLKGSFRCFWQDLFSPPPCASQRARISAGFHGRCHLEQALARGKGVILWESSSLGRRILAKRILYENGFPVCQIHSKSHIAGFPNPGSRITERLVQPLFESHERAFLKDLLILSRADSLRCSRELLERLRRNEIICISAEGRIGRKFIPITFLGRQDVFPTGIASLARATGATILPLFCIQDGKSLPSLIIESPIELDQAGERELSVERAILQYIKIAECYVRKYPEQYRAWNSSVDVDR